PGYTPWYMPVPSIRSLWRRFSSNVRERGGRNGERIGAARARSRGVLFPSRRAKRGGGPAFALWEGRRHQSPFRKVTQCAFPRPLHHAPHGPPPPFHGGG